MRRSGPVYGALFANVYPDQIKDLKDLGLEEMSDEDLLKINIQHP